MSGPGKPWKQLVQYFGTIMKEYRLDRSKDIREINRHIPMKVTANQNDTLLKPMEIQEAEDAVSQMLDGKALDLMNSQPISFTISGI